MLRVVAECLASGHLGIYESYGFSETQKCRTCGQRGLQKIRDEQGHKEMPLKQAEKFVIRETERRKQAGEGV